MRLNFFSSLSGRT